VKLVLDGVCPTALGKFELNKCDSTHTNKQNGVRWNSPQTKDEIMSDDLTKKRPQDASKVNIHEAWEVEYWCNELRVTKEQLVVAVKAVGVSAAAVRKHLGR
jgi:hypothetical protein